MGDATFDKRYAAESIRKGDIRSTTGEKAASSSYDYIIIGGGAAGCPLARTLSESGKDVLLIERGGPRKDNPGTLDIYGAGWVIEDEDVSQLIVTKEGIRSHVASVLSGGTAINMAIVISEMESYYEYLMTFPGVSFNMTLLKEAMQWTLNYVAKPMRQTEPYGKSWRQALSDVFGSYVGYSNEVKSNNTWGGYSLFDSQNNFYRNAADMTLGKPGIDFPKSLNVLLRHTAHKIETEPSDTSELRATCVIVQPTTDADTAPILNDDINPDTHITFGILRSGRQRGRYSTQIPKNKSHRICIKPGGSIISSAGAILTPILMFKSGIGPEEIVKNSGAPSVKVVPNLGKNLKDRALVAISLFTKGRIPPEGFPPSICQSTAMAQLGPGCTSSMMGQRSLTCSTVTAEELSGGRIAEGVIYSTRLILPPAIRSDPFLNIVLKIIQDCSQGVTPLQNVFLVPICPIARPIAKCFRRLTSNFSFTAEPKSLATLRVGPKGEVSIEGNYLTDPQDLQDAVRGIGNIIRVINSGYYDDIFEPSGSDSCPLTVLNGLLRMVNSRMVESQSVMGLSLPSSAAAEAWLKAEIAEYSKLHASAQENCADGICIDESEPGFNATGEAVSTESQLEGAWFNLFGDAGLPRRFGTSNKFATFPAVVPEIADEEGLKKFARTWMTSIWHWVGSASLGDVVDSNFRMKGFRNLYIVDASVLNQVSRMNPLILIMALGRYAGFLISGLN